MTFLLDWIVHGGPRHPKHQGWVHPITVIVLHYLVVTFVGFYLHDLFFDACGDNDNNLQKQRRRSVVGTFLFGYWSFVLLWRLLFRIPPKQATLFKPSNLILYDYCWLCNVTLLQTALAFYTRRPLLGSTYCIIIGIDQILWYVDILGFCLTKKWWIGVAKYLFWPSSSNWTHQITSTHHLWTIPLILYGVGGNTIPIKCYVLSFMLMTVNVVLSNATIPPNVVLRADRTGKAENGGIYLNVNLSHALWSDIKLSFLQYVNDPSPVRYLCKLLPSWQGYNGLVYGFLSICLYCLSAAEESNSYC